MRKEAEEEEEEEEEEKHYKIIMPNSLLHSLFTSMFYKFLFPELTDSFKVIHRLDILHPDLHEGDVHFI